MNNILFMNGLPERLFRTWFKRCASSLVGGRGGGPEIDLDIWICIDRYI